MTSTSPAPGKPYWQKVFGDPHVAPNLGRSAGHPAWRADGTSQTHFPPVDSLQAQRPSAKSHTSPPLAQNPPAEASSKLAGQPGPTPGCGCGQVAGAGSLRIQLPSQVAVVSQYQSRSVPYSHRRNFGEHALPAVGGVDGHSGPSEGGEPIGAASGGADASEGGSAGASFVGPVVAVRPPHANVSEQKRPRDARKEGGIAPF
jgi:hypothetical protein